jgi:hypothetical protein
MLLKMKDLSAMKKHALRAKLSRKKGFSKLQNCAPCDACLHTESAGTLGFRGVVLEG